MLASQAQRQRYGERVAPLSPYTCSAAYKPKCRSKDNPSTQSLELLSSCCAMYMAFHAFQGNPCCPCPHKSKGNLSPCPKHTNGTCMRRHLRVRRQSPSIRRSQVSINSNMSVIIALITREAEPLDRNQDVDSRAHTNMSCNS